MSTHREQKSKQRKELVPTDVPVACGVDRGENAEMIGMVLLGCQILR